MVASGKKERSMFSRVAFTAGAVTAAVLLLVSYGSMVVNPARFWYLTIFGLLYLPLVFLCGILFVWGLFRKAWGVSALLLIILLPSIIWIGRYFQFNGHPADGSRGDLKVLSYNVGLFANGQGEYAGLPREDLSDKVSAYLAESDADVICLQEFHMPSSVSVSAYLKHHFPSYTHEYYVYTGANGRFGNVILTRFPVLGKGHIDFEGSTNMAIYTDLDVRGTKIRVYNCHFESYNISLSHLVSTIRKDGAVEESGRKFRRSVRVRPRQVDEVMANIDACREQILVVGDFNDNPLSYTYHRLIRDRKDAFIEVGKGFGATYSAFWPMLRIDYILYPSVLEARWYKREDVKYSDHYPISASFLQ